MSTSPFRIDNFWSVATPGTTLCLLNGIYQGNANMISPSTQGAAPGLSGQKGRPITIRALNDGGVLIDGQFQRIPVRLSGNSWFVLEGFNARNSGAGPVVSINTQSNYNVVRRVVAWDANINHNNAEGFGFHNSNFLLLEDVAAFGTSRKNFSNSQGGNYLTCRRCWGRWEGSTKAGAKMTYTLMYNSFGALCENCLGTWSAESMPESYELVGADSTTGTGQFFGKFQVESVRGIISVDRNYPDYQTPVGARVLGSIAYHKPTDRPAMDLIGLLRTFGGETDFHYRDMLVYTPFKHRGVHLASETGKSYGSVSGTNRTAHNITAIRPGSPSDIVGSNWDPRNFSVGDSLTAVANPWANTGAGANLCYRYVDGVRTNEPLWPWPMNDRIKTATSMAGAYTGPCLNCSGGRLKRTATDVTADIETLLGPISRACRR